jgi:hypothetical protein
MDSAYHLLKEYQRLAQGARPPKREEVLVSRPPPLAEAPWANSATLKADLDLALGGLPFEMALMVFMDICLGSSDWSRGLNKFDWRRQVAEWWGLTPGEVNARVRDGVERVQTVLSVPRGRGY